MRHGMASALVFVALHYWTNWPEGVTLTISPSQDSP
jgi:hypothetical protein